MPRRPWLLFPRLLMLLARRDIWMRTLGGPRISRGLKLKSEELLKSSLSYELRALLFLCQGGLCFCSSRSSSSLTFSLGIFSSSDSDSQEEYLLRSLYSSYRRLLRAWILLVLACFSIYYLVERTCMAGMLIIFIPSSPIDISDWILPENYSQFCTFDSSWLSIMGGFSASNRTLFTGLTFGLAEWGGSSKSTASLSKLMLSSISFWSTTIDLDWSYSFLFSTSYWFIIL